MLDAIKYNLLHLADFSGRDARPTFWYYVLFLIVVWFALGLIMAIPLTMDVTGAAIEGVQSGMSEAELQAAMMSRMTDSLQGQMLASTILTVVMCGLFVAAFVRRLHDAGFTGWIAAIPIAVQFYSAFDTYINFDARMALMQETMAANDPEAMMAMQGEMASYGLLSWVAYLAVIGFGVLKSQDGANRYGDEPVRF